MDQYSDYGIEQFMTLFNKMFTSTKYSLQALNKRVEKMDKCFNNIMLLMSEKPFDEEPDEEENNFRITQKELDYISKMIEGNDGVSEGNRSHLLGRKKKKEPPKDEIFFDDNDNDEEFFEKVERGVYKSNKAMRENRAGARKIIEVKPLQQDENIIENIHPAQKIVKYGKYLEAKNKNKKTQKLDKDDDTDSLFDDDLSYDDEEF